MGEEVLDEADADTAVHGDEYDYVFGFGSIS